MTQVMGVSGDKDPHSFIFLIVEKTVVGTRLTQKSSRISFRVITFSPLCVRLGVYHIAERHHVFIMHLDDLLIYFGRRSNC